MADYTELVLSIEHEISAWCEHITPPNAPCDECQRLAPHRAHGLIEKLLASPESLLRALGGEPATPEDVEFSPASLDAWLVPNGGI